MKLFRTVILSTVLSTGLLIPSALRAADPNPAFAITHTPSPLAEMVNSNFMNTAGLIDPAAIKGFYTRRGEAYYWQNVMGVNRRTDDFIAVLANSWQHGLNPATYHTPRIKELRARPGTDAGAQLEILLTDAFIRYVRDMSGMRVKVSDLDLSNWRQPYTVQQCLAFMEQKPDISGVLDNITPKSQTYKQLQKQLIALVQKPPEKYLSILPISLGAKSLTPEERHKSVPDLRLRLGVQAETMDKYLYDDRLAAAVMAFQRDNNLPADGVIGPATLKLLNRSDEGKMLQIIANLERLRWVDEKRPEKFAMVNIPAATLWAVDHGRVAFQMPVIVGKAQRATQPFIATIQGVRFNPDWTVPLSIKKNDILPRLQADPNYLSDKGMELVRVTKEGEETIDPTSVDWVNISNTDLSHLEMVQMPGSNNPLGRIRILMPNKFDIYLHDTNEPEFFDQNIRAQSSGCIRMKDPEKMAAFVMEDEKGWSAAKMKKLLDTGTMVDAKIKNPIPVYILYYSAWADEYGRIIFGNDIYGLDRTLIEKLSVIDGFSLPGHNKIRPDRRAQAMFGPSNPAFTE